MEIVNILNNWNIVQRKEMFKLQFIQATTIFNLAMGFHLNDKEQNMRRSLKEIFCLVIDDISKFGETNKGNEMIYLDDLLRYRDLNMLPTFYTCQVPFNELPKVLTLPLADMIRGNCRVIEFRGDSQRQ